MMGKQGAVPTYAGIQVITSEFMVPGKICNMGGRFLVMSPEMAEAIAKWVEPTRWSYAWIRHRVKLWWAKLVLETKKGVAEADRLLGKNTPVPPKSDCVELIHLLDMSYKPLYLRPFREYKPDRFTGGSNLM